MSAGVVPLDIPPAAMGDGRAPDLRRWFNAKKDRFARRVRIDWASRAEVRLNRKGRRVLVGEPKLTFKQVTLGLVAGKASFRSLYPRMTGTGRIEKRHLMTGKLRARNSGGAFGGKRMG